MVPPLGRKVWRFLKRLKIELPHDPTVLLPGMDLEKNISPKDSCPLMFIAALFRTAKR